MVERGTGPTHRPWNGANGALVTAIQCVGLGLSVSFSGGFDYSNMRFRPSKTLCWKVSKLAATSGASISRGLGNLFGLPVHRAERNGSAAERVSKRRKKANWCEAKRQTEATTYAIARKDAARDDRAVCEAERAWSRGRRGRPAAGGGAAIRAMVTALKAVCVKSWNQDVKREPGCRLMGPIELKKSVMLPAGRSTHVGQHRFGWDVGDRKRSDSATE